MQFANPFLDGGHELAGGLHDQLAFHVALDGALPAIERRHRREQVDTRREPFVDERSGDEVAAIARGHRRQNQNNVSHSSALRRSLCTFIRGCCTVSSAWPHLIDDLLRSNSNGTIEPAAWSDSPCSSSPC